MANWTRPAVSTEAATAKTCFAGDILKNHPVIRMAPIIKMFRMMGAAAGAAKCLWVLRMPAMMPTVQMRIM